MIKQPQQASTRVAFNTGILYVKTLVVMGISLYSVRLILSALGVSDFGIFSLVAGIIAMLSFLNSAMTASTQRYLSFHQGTNDFEMQKKVFTNSWVLHLAIGAIVVVLLLLLTPFLFDGFLNIPADRIVAAKTVYYFMAVSVFFTIISVPFTASINAHENMTWIAVVNIIESIFRLGIALSLVWFIQAERLIMYGLFMALLSFVSFMLYAVFCLKKYNECNIKRYQIDKPLIKELTSFAGWNMFGALCGVGRAQGLAVILNIFFGTIVNAAYAVAVQVSAAASFFSQSMLRALNPQIMQSEGMNDRERMLRLSMMASKFGFFLFAIIAIPAIFEMPAILELWLKNVPEYAVAFCSLFLIVTLTNQITIGLQSAIQAVGKIKVYQTAVGGVLLLNLPIALLLLRWGFPAYSVLICAVIVEVIACVLRLILLKKIAGMSIKAYFKRVIFKGIPPLLALLAACWLITSYLTGDFRFLITSMVSAGVFLGSVYLMGLCKDEKNLLDNLAKKVIKI